MSDNKNINNEITEEIIDLEEVTEVTPEVTDSEENKKEGMSIMKKLKKKHLVCGLIAIAIVFAIIFALQHFNKKPQEQATISTNTINTLNIDSNQTDIEEANNKLASRYVYFSGFDNATVNADSKIKLNNLETNQDFLMQYQIYEDDKLVYETGLIKSGNSVYWQIGNTLSVGEHNLTIKQNPYYDVDGKGNYLPLTYGSCTVKFTVVE